jgi:hypothetical protein
VIDWEQSFEAIADELAALVSVNDLAPPGSPEAQGRMGEGRRARVERLVGRERDAGTA